MMKFLIFKDGNDLSKTKKEAMGMLQKARKFIHKNGKNIIKTLQDFNLTSSGSN